MVEQYLKRQPVEYSILYLDMDSFFASVEQQFNPALRGRPVAVCPCQSEATAVIAASIEAKQRGIYTGMKVYRARQLCPELAVVADSPVLYRQVHHALMAILDNTIGMPVKRGIDEAYIVLPSYARQPAVALGMAAGIKQALVNRVGSYIGCSIGLSSNIWLAKMAASFGKPNGLFALNLNRLDWFYRQVNLLDFNGINKRLARRFYDLGIYNPTQLYSASYAFLSRYFGVNGQKWYLRLRGYEVDRKPIGLARSMGHQVTLPPAMRGNSVVIRATFIKICYKLGYRLRKAGLKSRSMMVSLFFTDRTYAIKTVILEQLTSADRDLAKPEFIQLVLYLIASRLVRKMSVTMLDLSLAAQLPLFGSDSWQHEDLSAAIDQINNRYGSDTIVPAAVLTRSAATDHIGFGNV